MVVLKKINASTLMETLVATVLIIIVFMISSMVLNNLFSNSIKNNTRAIETHLNELQYLYMNKKLAIPYYDEFKSWNISIEMFKENGETQVFFEAINTNTNKTVEKLCYENS